MKKYKLVYPQYSFNLLEGIIQPNNYVKDIEVKLNKILNNIKDKKYDLKKLCSKLESCFSKNKILFFPEINIKDGGEIYIRYGINEGRTRSDRYSTIGIFCNPMLIKIQQSELFANEFRKWFLFVINHELIHRGQNLAIDDTKVLVKVGNKEFTNIKEYLSNKQEIMARAWEIIEYLKLKGVLTNNEILERLQRYKKDFRGLSNILDIYFNYFDSNSNEIKLLYKYMYLYLDMEN